MIRDAAKYPKQLTIPSTSRMPNAEDKNLRKELLEAMDNVIQEISFRFRRLELCGSPLRVVDRVSDEMVNELHNKLSMIDPNYNKDISEHARLCR